MATSPSPRIFDTTVDIYLPIEGRRGTGLEYTYASTPDFAGQPCAVQPVMRRLHGDDLGRLTQMNYYDVTLGQFLELPIRTKIIWKDSLGNLRNLLLETSFDDSGKGRIFVCRCREVV